MTAIGIQWHQLNETKRHNAEMEKISHLDRSSKEGIAAADRSSRESIAEQDRSSRYNIAYQDRRSKETISDRDRTSRERIASLDRASRESVSDLDRSSRENIASWDRLLKSDIANADRLNQYNMNERKLDNTLTQQARDLTWKQLENLRNYRRNAELTREVETSNRESREEIARLDRDYRLTGQVIQTLGGIAGKSIQAAGMAG